ncbi:Protein serine/threonine phosphatase [Elusimicrobium minutum Pei191]|uniref:Protein serine/threonine phosphatase n=1 Tax=Elusimicrobium minutum (strain Pei191) TaxID=445932 RepID=B2KD84_ELUMP|nr:Stp1/IreP family PP2C-type Ser/Thr phosphatase [Elusimicrobium minutum]ACC98480.1 Protein serine/threonine phosphatase [Elusimicrobium minutum Pei191]
MRYRLKLTAYSDIGKIREKNEDMVFISSDLGFAAVADGMGGHSAGEVASNVAISSFVDTLNKINENRISLPKDFLPDLSKIERKMLMAADYANYTVYKMAQDNQMYRTMGTTLSCVLIDSDNAYIVHIGDTRVYLYRAGAFSQVTTDHSLAAEHVKRGILTKNQAEKSAVQNVLTRAMGIKKDVEFDILQFKIAPGDILFLCSDGVNKGLTDEEIKQFISKSGKTSITKICKAIVKKSNEKDGKDNVSAAMIQVLSAPGFLGDKWYKFKSMFF